MDKWSKTNKKAERQKVIENINFKLIIFKIKKKQKQLWERKTNFENNKKQNGLKNDNEILTPASVHSATCR